MDLPPLSLYTDATLYFEGLEKDILSAQTSVNLEVYIFNTDPVGWRIAQCLAIVAKKGIKVRLLVDGVGSPFWGGPLVRLLENSGAITRVYHPIPWHFWQWSRTTGVWPFFQKIFTYFQRLNRRNHRKVCVVDDQIAWLGSFNISQDHLPTEMGGNGWKDCAVRAVNPSVAKLTKAFNRAWTGRLERIKSGELLSPLKIDDSPFRFNDTFRRRKASYSELIKRLKNAKERVWITNAYFVPDRSLLVALKECARRGVDVRLLLPEVSDVFFFPAASSHFYSQLVKNHVKIFEYRRGILHAKTLIIDHSWATVGSSNLNSRSLKHDLEVDLEISEKEIINKMVSEFNRNLTESHQIRLESLPAVPLKTKIIAFLALLFRNWI